MATECLKRQLKVHNKAYFFGVELQVSGTQTIPAPPSGHEPSFRQISLYLWKIYVEVSASQLASDLYNKILFELIIYSVLSLFYSNIFVYV